MTKVVSTKLKVDELARFTVMAEQQGETKAGLLRRLVLEYLGNGDKVDDVDPAGRPDLYERVIRGLPDKKPGSGDSQSSCQSIKPYSPLIREDPGIRRMTLVSQQSHAKVPVPNPVAVISKLRQTDVGGRSNALTPYKGHLPVYHNDFKGRLEVSKTSSTVKGLVFLLALIWLGQKFRPSSTQ